MVYGDKTVWFWCKCWGDNRRQNQFSPIIINGLVLPYHLLHSLHANSQFPIPSQQFLLRAQQISAIFSANTRTNGIFQISSHKLCSTLSTIEWGGLTWNIEDIPGKSQSSTFERKLSQSLSVPWQKQIDSKS